MKKYLIQTVEKVMGLGCMHGTCLLLARTGLRGLGVNIHYDLTRSGELWLLRRLRGNLGGWICIDVGANIGDYTNALVRSGAREVHSFEPSPCTFRRLHERFSGSDNVKLVNLACGESEETSEFFIAKDANHSTLNSRDSSLTALPKSEFFKVVVPTTRLDSYCSQHALVPDFVKIDVEGFESEVIVGMSGLIDVRPPKLIQFEFNEHHRKRRQDIGDFVSLLPGYKIFRLAAQSLRPLDQDSYLSNIYGYSNMIAVHNSFIGNMRT